MKKSAPHLLTTGRLPEQIYSKCKIAIQPQSHTAKTQLIGHWPLKRFSVNGNLVQA
jgi:hypothetical protein